MSTSPDAEVTKKRGLMSKLFGFRSNPEQAKRRVERLHSVDVTTFRKPGSLDDVFDKSINMKERSMSIVTPPQLPASKSKSRKQSVPTPTKSKMTLKLVEEEFEPSEKKSTKKKSSGRQSKGLRHRKQATSSGNGGRGAPLQSTDPTRPLEFPATPELILEHHRRKPFLNQNEEWLIVELNEYECLVDSMEIVKIIAKHSKFFEVEPDELWEEFFEFVEDVPSYDEIVNYDVWQEFRDKRYAC